MIDPFEEPALVTPPGLISQFPTTHSNEQKWFFVCVIICAAVSGFFLLLRLYTKLHIVRKLDLTDYIIVTSFLFLLVMFVCGRKCLAEGAGVHQWNLRVHDLIGVSYWLYIAQILYAPTIFLAKTALLLQYLRLFAPQKTINPLVWYSARIIIVVTGVYYIISTFITTFACSPREAIWNPLITDARCLDNSTSILFTCLFNIVSDIFILLLPTRAVWKLRIPTRRKVGIVLLFAIGLLACIANAMIIVYVVRIRDDKYDIVLYDAAGEGFPGKSADVSYNTAWEGLWAFAEITFGIIVTCTFSLPKLIEAEGSKLQGAFSNLMRPFVLFKSLGFFRNSTQSKRDSSASQDLTLDSITMMKHSDSSRPTSDRVQDVERFPDENGYEPVKYPSVDAATIPHQF